MPIQTSKLDLEISVAPDDKDLAQSLLQCTELNPQPLESAGFDGGGGLITILVTVTPALVTLLIRVMKQHTERWKNVKIKVGGMSVDGAPPDRIEAILTQLLKAQKSSDEP